MHAINSTNRGRWLGLALAITIARCASAQEAPVPSPDANAAPPPSAPPLLSAAELQKLAEPIALYPDPLISIVLPAAAYPVEIVQAARFVRDPANVSHIDEQPWDQNVKSVAKFPQVISMMDSNLSWTVALGEAFINQQTDLMNAIQVLRGMAVKAGTLQSTPQQVVVVTNTVVVQPTVTQVVAAPAQIVEIIPASPQVVYVPTYPPTVFYPPPAYVYNPLAPLITFGAGVAVGAIIANNCNWWHGGIYVGPRGGFVWGGSGYRGNVNVNINNFNTYNRNVNVNNSRTANVNNVQKWQPDSNRMRTGGSGTATASTREARGWSSGGAQASTGAIGSRPSTGNVGTRPSTGTVGTRPSTGNAGTQAANRTAPSTSTFQNRSSSAASQPSTSNSAFSGVSNGSAARNYSSRGTSSLSGGGGGGFSGGRAGGARGGGGRR